MRPAVGAKLIIGEEPRTALIFAHRELSSHFGHGLFPWQFLATSGRNRCTVMPLYLSSSVLLSDATFISSATIHPPDTRVLEADADKLRDMPLPKRQCQQPEYLKKVGRQPQSSTCPRIKWHQSSQWPPNDLNCKSSVNLFRPIRRPIYHPLICVALPVSK